MERIPSKPQTAFVTFYSFKGGVGRTLALVNTACILAGRGRRVLMIDFDLEAPGLTMLALRQLTSNNQLCPAGLVDLIHGFLTDPENSPILDKDNPFRYKEFLCSLNIPKHLIRLEGGKLDLIPCGRLDSHYEERFYQIDFAKLYAEGIGQPLFKYIKKLIKNSNLYDYIFIDSRTGFSDEVGISTRDLADHIIVITTLNRQNIEGTSRFLERLKDSNWQEGKIIFVLSPLPIGYEELRSERTRYAKRIIEDKIGINFDSKLYIPYHPRIALDEEPFLYNWTESDLFKSYESICSVIQELAEDTSLLWANRTLEAIQKGQIAKGINYLKIVGAEDEKLQDQVLYTITNALKRRIPELWENANSIIKFILKFKPRTVNIILNCIDILMDIGEYNRALKLIEEVYETSISDNNEKLTILCHIDLARNFQLRGDYEKAIKELEAASEKAKKMGDESYYYLAKHFIAHIYEDVGKYDDAINEHETILREYKRNNFSDMICIANTYSISGKIEQSIKIYEKIKDMRKEMDEDDYFRWQAKYGIDKINYGEIEDGKKMFGNGIEYFKIKNDYGVATHLMLNYAKALEYCGKFDDLKKYLKDNYEYINKFSDKDGAMSVNLLRAKIKIKFNKGKAALKELRRVVKYYQSQSIHTKEANEARLLFEELRNSLGEPFHKMVRKKN